MRKTRLRERKGSVLRPSFALALTALTLSGCATLTGSGADSSSAEEGCGACTSEMAEVERQVRAIDGIDRVEQLGYAEPVALTRPDAVVSGRVVLTQDADPADVLDQVVEVVWRSDLSPIGEVGLRYAVAPDDFFSNPEYFSLVENREEYRSRWGPRTAPGS